MKTKITTLLLVFLLVTICGISALANEAETKITVEELQAKVAELEERISILEELLLEADEAEEQSQQSDMIQTQRDNINVKIYENEYLVSQSTAFNHMKSVLLSQIKRMLI